MTPREALEMMRQRVHVKLLPPLSEATLEDMQRIGHLSREAKDLLSLASGFRSDVLGEVSFLGRNEYEFPGLFPAGLVLAKDDFGNMWVLDVAEDSGTWGPVFFFCHDPPAVVIQAPELAAFILMAAQDRHLTAEAISAAGRVWAGQERVVDVGAARKSVDRSLAQFAWELPEGFYIADLRDRQPGSGFSWGKAGANAHLKRHPSELIFGIEGR